MAKRRWGGVIAGCFAMLCALAVSLPTQAAYAAEGNLALRKTAVADSQEAPSVAPALAVDGDTTSRTSRWGSNIDKNHGQHWIYVDLGEDTTVSSAKVFWENRKATGFKIQTAAAADAKGDDSTKWGWKDVYSSTDRPATITSTVNFEPVTARYVRLLITGFTAVDPDGTTDTWDTVSIYELEVYAAKQEVPVEATNLALKKTTKASADYHNEHGARAVDGKKKDSKKDRWMTESAPAQWLRVDLGKEESIKHFSIQWENSENYATAFDVYATNDKALWDAEGDNHKSWGKPVVSEKNNKKGLYEVTLETPATGRYLLLHVTGMSTNYGVSCMEFEAWNAEPPAPEKQPADYLNDIQVTQPTAESTELEYTLPKAPAGYEIKYNGTDYEQVIDLDGTIFHPVSDVTVKASFKIENTKDNTDYAFKEFDVTVPGTKSAAKAANPAPQVLPELREWAGGEGQFAASAAKRVVYGDNSLKAMAEEFASDFQVITGVKLSVVSGTAANAGDIFFGLTDNKALGLKDEGYLLDAKSDRITVTAEKVAGANWGGKTILQAMKTGENNFPVGVTRDYPLYKVRGIILDVGRKTFTLDWLKQITKQMSFFKMNDFQVHLNDNLIPLEHYTQMGEDAMKAYSGFRLESDVKKGGNNGLNQADLTSTDVWYSKADFKEYIEHSKALGVNIVPEIDTPAHSLALTKVRPDLRYGTNGRQNDHLDLRGEKFDQSLGFVQDIFDEYVKGNDPVFEGSDVIHIGADEYNVGSNAESSPLYRKFVNEMFDYAYENGHTPRVWGSLSQYTKGEEIHVNGPEEGQRAQINLWNWGYANMDKMYEMGFDLIDCNDGHFYIVPNAGYYYDWLNDGVVYNDPLNSIGEVTIPAGDPQVIGGAYAVWNDMTDYLENGISEYDVYKRLTSAMGLFAANGWGKGSLDVTAAKALATELGDDPAVNFGYETEADEDGTYAQWNFEGNLEDSSAMGRDLEKGKNTELTDVDGKQALKLNGGESFVSVKDDALTTIGLGNDLRVKVKRTDASTDEQVLFESEYGAIKAVQKGTGQVGITRENHDYSFNYTLPVDEWVELEFKNEFEQVSLYVNGKLVDTLGDGDKAAEGKALKATCMFPLNTLGSAKNSFKGYVDDVRVTVAPEAGFASTMELDYAVITAEKVLAEQEIPGLRELLDQAYALFLEVNPDAQAIADLTAKINALLQNEDGEPSYKVADYCRIDAYAQLKGNDVINKLFTEASVARVEAAWSLVREDLPASMQSTVDYYENFIVNALNDLELKDGGDLNFVDPTQLTATASDFQNDGSDPKNVLDGNLSSMWHSDWDITTGEHWLNLASEAPMSVEGIVYTPRQTGTNGNIQKYRIEVSTDGTAFKTIKEGDLKVSGTEPITIKFDRQDNVKAVKLVWVKAANGNAAASELRLLDAAAAPDHEGLQQILDAVKTVKQDGACKHDRFTDTTWNAFQEQVKAAEDCIANKSGDVNSVYALKGSLASAMTALRLEDKTVDPTPGEFTVTFDDRIPGHEDLVITVKEGDKIPVQPMPELAGYLFDGWFSDGFEGGWKNEWNFDDPVTSDLTLTAKWVENGDQPVDPGTETPVEPEGPNGGTDSALPQTGDNSMMIIGAVAGVAVIALVVGVVLRRRNSR
ncbi:MAG: discoidin domain-containing protein [Coriobacteriaceae bacterium]|nr:discoidin domain-containing protein [Coriobacteriaceae bacterium]